ncbi:hypothetical protein ACP4OV_013919 [Aristida adscensionis]
MRLRILQHLPLRDAIRTAALAQGWRRLWESRWAHPTSCLDVRLLPGDHPAKALRSLDPDAATSNIPPRRLDHFSLVVVGNARLRPQHLRRFLAHAAARRAWDVRVELRGVADLSRRISRASPSSPFAAAPSRE